jgi:hypothetical protein
MIVQAGLPAHRRPHVAVERSRLAVRDSPEARLDAREGLEREVGVTDYIDTGKTPTPSTTPENNSIQAGRPLSTDPPEGRLMIRACGRRPARARC